MPSQAATVQTATTTSIILATVDNQNFSYFVRMSINGTAGAAIMPVQAAVTYTLP